MPGSPRLGIELDPTAATPLYHQIVQAIRWKIGTGSLRPGDLLPSLRDAASRWKVSYHTVRHAYRDLAERGLVESVRGDGTRVLGSSSEVGTLTASAGLEGFVREVVLEAGHRFGAGPEDLARILDELGPPEDPPARRINLVECNEHQCTDLAGQLEARWSAQAVPWNLRWEGDPPPGPLVGTWFHYGEMRGRWPHRVGDMHFVRLRLDAAVIDRVVGVLAAAEPRRITLFEADVGTGRQHAADLLADLPFEVELEVRGGLPDPSALREDPGLAVVAPRLWDDLTEVVRQEAHVIELRHVFDPGDLADLGERLGLDPAPGSGGAPGG